MYATLQINAEKNSFDRVETSPAFRLACVNCRAKKLKCTGEATGCDRCLSRGFACQYSAPAEKGSRNRNGDGAKSKAAGVSKAKSRSGSIINNPSKDSGRISKPLTPPASVQGPRLSVQRELPEPETSESPQRLADREIPSTTSTDVERRASNSPAAAADNFSMEGNTAFPAGAPFDPDVDMFNTENGLGADVWDNLNPTGDFSSHRLEAFIGLMAPTPPTPPTAGSSSANTDTLYQSDLSNRNSGSHLANLDSSFLYNFNIPSVSPPAGKEIQTQSPQGFRPQSSLTRVERPAFQRDVTVDAFSSGMDRQINDAPLSSEPCGCVKLALSMLEALSIHTVSITRPEISRILHLGKNILARCKRLLCCERCRSSSSFVMLLIVITKDLLEAYERVLELLVEQFNEQHNTQVETARGTVPSSQQHFSSIRQHGISQLQPRLQQQQQHPSGDGDITAGWMPDGGNLHGYQFDAEEEPAVFGGVTRLQLSLLLSFLLNIRNVLSQHEWDSHLPRVEDTAARIKTQLALFGTRPGRIFDRQ